MVNLNQPTEPGHAGLDALNYAWGEMAHHPYDGGACRVEFEAVEREIYGRYNERRGVKNIIGKVREYQGGMSASTEEGGRSVHVRVHRPIHHQYDPETGEVTGYEAPDDRWYVQVDWTSRDCDGRYSGGHTVQFQDGQKPEVTPDITHDYAAEAAGY